ncbi:hypothetical protein E2I00_018690 [Balaenoptera physalus]|uniref:V-SNARE coiled-coil homology domain-containing protein n=1 Tax=Balaenoptera physalus TaxID=9770 RepID=A0A643BQ10_BALPH|nr:hypothetical protein E2I00_018690 [Balaenoptera physalus]
MPPKFKRHLNDDDVTGSVKSERRNLLEDDSDEEEDFFLATFLSTHIHTSAATGEEDSTDDTPVSSLPSAPATERGPVRLLSMTFQLNPKTSASCTEWALRDMSMLLMTIIYIYSVAQIINLVVLCPFLAPTPSPISSVQNQVDEVIDVMQENITKVIERGERLDELQDKSESLSDNATAFSNRSKQLRRQMWWRGCKKFSILQTSLEEQKIKAIMALVAVIVLLVIIILIVVKYHT